ncbi:MAG: four helix bundle protein [Opitutales bacterium]
MDEEPIALDEDWVLREDEPMYRKLRIYETASRLSDDVWASVTVWEAFAKDTLGEQVVRSADSSAANLAEGSGRGTNPELLRFARIARGSPCETQHWVTRAARRNLLESQKVNQLQTSLESLLKQLNAFIATMSKKQP